MAIDDNRYYEILYGFYVDDWQNFWGSITSSPTSHKMLDTGYVDNGCSTTDYSVASVVNIFLYPFYIKSVYFIEGVIKGQITLGTSGATSLVASYRVALCKTNSDLSTDVEIATTDWVTVNDTLHWDAGLGIGDEIVYPFWIDCWEEYKLTENDRLYLKVEVSNVGPTILYHTNAGNTIDLKVEVPMRGV